MATWCGSACRFSLQTARGGQQRRATVTSGTQTNTQDDNETLACIAQTSCASCEPMPRLHHGSTAADRNPPCHHVPPRATNRATRHRLYVFTALGGTHATSILCCLAGGVAAQSLLVPTTNSRPRGNVAATSLQATCCNIPVPGPLPTQNNLHDHMYATSGQMRGCGTSQARGTGRPLAQGSARSLAQGRGPPLAQGVRATSPGLRRQRGVCRGVQPPRVPRRGPTPYTAADGRGLGVLRAVEQAEAPQDAAVAGGVAAVQREPAGTCRKCGKVREGGAEVRRIDVAGTGV